MKIGRITVSDRAAAGIYTRTAAALKSNGTFANSSIPTPNFLAIIIPDDPERISQTLRHLADHERCSLIVTTGGTGITSRDVTPDATRPVLDRELPGFGELMRIRSFERVPTSILSRAMAGTRGGSLIINLPGKPPPSLNASLCSRPPSAKPWPILPEKTRTPRPRRRDPEVPP
jgi:molybdopterin adenylyltransferase